MLSLLALTNATSMPAKKPVRRMAIMIRSKYMMERMKSKISKGRHWQVSQPNFMKSPFIGPEF
jgi:hypothetical protein